VADVGKVLKSIALFDRSKLSMIRTMSTILKQTIVLNGASSKVFTESDKLDTISGHFKDLF